jgi:anti-sigma B factor antagonist
MTDTSPTWRHEVRTIAGHTTVYLSGELDALNATALQELLLAAAARAAMVTIDLAEVTFIDSGTITVLIVARKSAHDAGHRLVIANPKGHVHRVLTVTGMLRALSTDPG